MKTVKLLSMILLAGYLIFSTLSGFAGYVPTGAGAFLLGVLAFGSGLLILVSIEEFVHYGDY